PADRAQLQQALVYILQTALDGPQTDGMLRFITRQVEEEVQLIITNSGHPPPPEKSRYLFDPFHQSIQHSYGLGFAIAYGIIEAHGGSVQVDSRPDGGITFTLRLPTHPADL
ncbi:MAG: two-component sensor histidine kinase, partial [Caldilineae bacterium]